MKSIALAMMPVALLVANVAHAQIDDACIAASDHSIASRKEGKLLDARADLAKCAAPECPDVVRSSCEQRLAQINAVVPTMVFVMKDGNGRDLGGVKLTIDGTLYSEKLGGEAIPLDPVDHEFKFEVGGVAPVVVHFVLHERDARREVITIGAPTLAAPPPPPSVAPQAEPAPAHRWSTYRILGWSTIGLSVISAALGSGFGVAAISNQSDASNKSNCPQTTVCYPAGAKLIDDAKTNANISTAMFVVAGAALAGGVTLLVLSPSSAASSNQTSTTARLTLGAPQSTLGLSLGGAW